MSRDIGDSIRLYNAYDYTKKSKIKNALRNSLRFSILAEKGDTVSHSILIDMKNALSADTLLSVVTPKQRQAIILNLVYGYTTLEISRKLGISHQAVSARINSGIDKIQEYLLKRDTSICKWETWEDDIIIKNYRRRKAKWCSKKLPHRNIREIYTRARKLKSYGLLQ